MQDTNTYSIDEFVAEAIQRGYASRRKKEMVVQWCKKNPKDRYTEDDLIELYRYLEIPKIGDYVPHSKWHHTWDGHKTTRRTNHYKNDGKWY